MHASITLFDKPTSLLCYVRLLTITQKKIGTSFYMTILEISVKSGKDSTNTPSLVIHRVRFKKKTCIKVHQHSRGRGETQKTIDFDGSCVSPCLCFFLSASTAATQIFTAPTCTATIIPLEPCVLNGEIRAQFQHFILRFK